MVRRHGAQLVYTQMVHADTYLSDAKYAQSVFDPNRLEGSPEDRPLILQLSGNDPKSILQVAQQLRPFYDAIDLNLGCPQRRAQELLYGSYLLERKYWPLVQEMVKTLSKNNIPVWCKIRLIPDGNNGERCYKATIEFSKVLQEAGCSCLVVHARYPSAARRRKDVANLDAVKAIWYEIHFALDYIVYWKC